MFFITANLLNCTSAHCAHASPQYWTRVRNIEMQPLNSLYLYCIAPACTHLLLIVKPPLSSQMKWDVCHVCNIEVKHAEKLPKALT